MKKSDIYGFTVTNSDGLGFIRYFNGSDNIITDNPEGKLPFGLRKIYVTQLFLQFHPARTLSESLTKRSENLTFKIITYEDWKKIEHPVKRFFKNLFKKSS